MEELNASENLFLEEVQELAHPIQCLHEKATIPMRPIASSFNEDENHRRSGSGLLKIDFKLSELPLESLDGVQRMEPASIRPRI